MAKLTDTQLIVLSKAAARDHGLATIPEGLNKAAASKVGAGLVTRKLMREVQSKPDMPVRMKRGAEPALSLRERAGRRSVGNAPEHTKQARKPEALI